MANSLTEVQMSEFFGWVRGSDMPSVCVHLSGRDVDNALLKTYGIADSRKETEESALKARNCPRCDIHSAPTNKSNSRCGMLLSKEALRR